jgi:hypothetical protein
VAAVAGPELVRLRDELHYGGRPVGGQHQPDAGLCDRRLAHAAARLQRRPPALLLPGRWMLLGASMHALLRVDYPLSYTNWQALALTRCSVAKMYHAATQIGPW